MIKYLNKKGTKQQEQERERGNDGKYRQLILNHFIIFKKF